MPRIRIGVLGCADIARRRALPAFRACPATEPVAVASRFADKAGALAAESGCRPVVGYEELLAAPDVDAVYVPVPTGLHAEWCAKALAAGKHVLVEKPMTASAAEAHALADLALERGLVLMENRMFARHPQHTVVRELIDAGEIGEPKMVSASMLIPARRPGDIRYRPDLGGGALLDVGYYPMHAAMMLLGPELEVAGAIIDRDEVHGVDVGGSVLLRAGSGIAAQLTFGFNHFYRASYQVWGCAGTVTAQRAFTPPSTLSAALHVEDADGARQIVTRPFDQFRAVAADFARAVRGNPCWTSQLTTSVRGMVLLDEVRARSAFAPASL